MGMSRVFLVPENEYNKECDVPWKISSGVCLSDLVSPPAGHWPSRRISELEKTVRIVWFLLYRARSPRLSRIVGSTAETWLALRCWEIPFTLFFNSDSAFRTPAFRSFFDPLFFLLLSLRPHYQLLSGLPSGSWTPGRFRFLEGSHSKRPIFRAPVQFSAGTVQRSSIFVPPG